MDACGVNEPTKTRVLGLGNEILADDAFGIRAAREVESRYPGQAEVVCSSAAGFGLLDDVLGAPRLIVIDAAMTGTVPPGTIHRLAEDEMRETSVAGPHFVGLFEVLAAGRQMGLDVPETATVIAVEASDCTTVGGPMHPDVERAIPEVVDLVGGILGGG